MNTHTMLATLEAHKRACQMRRAQMLRPLPELARIFRSQRAVQSPLLGRALMDNEDLKATTVEELEAFIPAETFERFLAVNRLTVYENVIR